MGYVKNDVFYKRVREGDHLYKLLDAWAMDIAVFESVAMGCKQIRIYDEQRNVVYAVHPLMWRQNGVEKEHKPHGRQTFLPRKFFKQEAPRDKSEATKLTAFLKKRNEKRP